jgi:hypothetical protein
LWETPVLFLQIKKTQIKKTSNFQVHIQRQNNVPFALYLFLFKNHFSWNFSFDFGYSFICWSIALQLFVGPWPRLQFHNPFYKDGKTPWTSDQPVARPIPKHRTTQTHNKHIHRDIHALSGDIGHTSQLPKQSSWIIRPRLIGSLICEIWNSCGGGGWGERPWRQRPLVKITCVMVDPYYFAFVATLTTLSVTENNRVEWCDQSNNGLEGIWKEDVVI